MKKMFHVHTKYVYCALKKSRHVLKKIKALKTDKEKKSKENQNNWEKKKTKVK